MLETMRYFNRCILLWLVLWGSVAVGGENFLPAAVQGKIENRNNVQNILRARAEIFRMNAPDDAWACEVIREGFIALGFAPSDPIFDIYVSETDLPRKIEETENSASASDFLLRALDLLRSDSSDSSDSSDLNDLSDSAIDRAEAFVKRSASRVSAREQRAYAALGGLSAQRIFVDTLVCWSETTAEISAETRVAQNVPRGSEDGDTPVFPDSGVLGVVGGCVSVSRGGQEARGFEVVLPTEVRSRRVFPCVAGLNYVVGYHLISQTNILLI